MDVELLYFDGCPHWQSAAARLQQVAAELGATVHHRQVTSSDVDHVPGFAGSPTILIDGDDPFPRTSPSARGLSCRLYPTPNGPAGSPTLDQLRTALRSADAA